MFHLPMHDNKMLTEILNIDKGQCLTDVLPAIPANTIFDKTITGCGATHSEIVNAARHSIIIEPNIPVVRGRTKTPKGIKEMKRL